jgi:phenylacetate-CoA ligase
VTADSVGIAFRRGLIRFYEGGLQRRSVFRYWRELDASQWQPLDQLQAAQFNRLRQFLLRVQVASPWYGASWRAIGLDARDLHQPADFQRWPVIDKDVIRTHRVAMRSTTPGLKLIAKATGGSSGVPMQFDLDTDSNERRMAAWHRGYEWAGAAPGTRQWYLWGVAPSSSAAWRKQKARLYDRLYRRTTVSCFELGEATLQPFLDSLVRTRPHVIVSYTNAIYAFARMLEANGCTPPSPRSVVVGAEKLHDFQRATIERVFRAPVFETYGCREFMLIGAECERHCGLHLTMENLHVELVDDEGAPVAPGVEGNVVVTDLTNSGMPFVRYATGDRAVASPGQCACGRGLPLLSKVTGRRLDILSTPDGRALPGEFFPHIIKELGSVQRYQVIQERLDTIVVKLVAPGWTRENEDWLRREVSAVAGPAVRLEIQPVDEIPLTAAGKLQVVVNRLGTPGRSENA